MKRILQKSLCRLQALLLIVVMFVAGGSAVWAEDLTATFDLAISNGQEGWSNNSVTTNEITCERSGSYASTGINLWQATNYIKVSVPSEVKITKIVLRGLQGYFNGSSYGSINITKTNGSFEGGATSWTSSSDATWENTDATFEVQFSTTYGNDFYVRYVDVYTGTTVDDGFVKSTFNFNQASVPFVNAAGVAGNLQGGNRPSIGDVFTAPSGGATLTFNYVGESWSNSAQRLRLDSNASFTIAAPEGFEMTNIVFTTDLNTMNFSSKSGLTGNGSAKATWEGQSESETFTISALSFIQNIKVTMVPVAEEGEITYTIDLVDAPTGAYVTLDEQRFEAGDTYTVEKSFGKNDLTVYEPEGYYAEVEYTRDNHTYTVTYHAYNYYDVTVTGTTDPAAGVVFNEQTYGDGTRIETKDVLTESSVKAAEVANMKGTVSMTGNTYSVDYQEKLDFVIMTNTGVKTYTQDGITITGGGTMFSCINLWSSWEMSVTSEVFPIERIELEEYRDAYYITATSDPVGYSNMVWTGKPTNTVTFKAAGGDWAVKSVHVYLYKPQPTNYTIEFVNAPDEAYITLDGQTIHKVNDGYEVAKVLDASSVTYAYEPVGYYADVTYDEENHKFTVTYVEGYRVEFGTEFSGQTITTDGISYDRGWSWGELYQTSFDGYGRIYVKSETKSIKKVEIACNGSASPVIEESGVGSMAANGNTAVWTASEEGVVQDLTFYSTSSSSLAVSKVTVYYNELPNINYPVVIAVEGDLPADFTPTVTVDGKNFTENGTYSTPKPLTKANVSATLPENGDWYYDVDYAEATNTFTVTYKEYLHYFVSVEGCDDETAGVRNGSNTFHDGDKINVKEPLTAEALTAVTVNGYDVTAPVVGEGTVTVTYAVAGLVDYAVTITGMPAGASVKIEDQVFDENTDNGVHQSNKTLSSSVVTIQNCPETHYTNESSEWFDAEGKAFNIAFTPYLVYTVAVDEASAYQGGEAGVKVFNANTYLPGQPIYNKTALTVNDVKATDVDGYTGTVTLADNVFTVSYTKNDFIVFDASKFTQDGGYGNLDETIEGVRLQCWDSGEYFGVNNRSNSHIVLSSSEAPIVKVEAEYISWGKPSYGYATIDGKNTGELNTEADITTWTGTTKDLELWDSTNNTAYVTSIKVYLAQPTTYHVNITGMPAEGATVVVNNDYVNGYYTANGNYDYVTYDELNESSITAIAPESHKVDKNYDASTKTFEITYTALPEYTYAIAIYPQDKANEFKIWIDGNEYGDTGMDEVTFYRLLTENDIYAPEQAGYEIPVVEITNTVGNNYLINVTYTALPTLAIGSSATDNEGNYWTSFCYKKPVSFPEGVTPCIVTGAEDGKLTIQEFESIDNQATTTLDFMNGTVFENNSRLFDESGNAADVTVVRNGGRIESQYLGLNNSSCPTLTITSNSSEPISKIIVSPWGWGSGYCCSFNGGAVVDVPNDPYTFDVNATSCTLAFTPRDGNSIYVTKIEIVVGENTIPVIPANTGILLKSNEAKASIAYTVHEEGVETVDVSANKLQTSGESGFSVTNDPDNLYYKLTLNAASEPGSAGFYWGKNSNEGHSISVPAHKAYLKLPVAAASNRAAFLFTGDDTITAIEGINAEADNAPVYNLQGQRVNATKAGVYVKNGRKVIVK